MVIKEKMTEIDQIINDVLKEELSGQIADTPIAADAKQQTEILRERLIGVAVAGQSEEFLGKKITSLEIETLNDEELRKLYVRYEKRVGSMVTKSIKKNVITAFVNGITWFLPSTSFRVIDREKLEESLNEATFIDLALKTFSTPLYHNFGHLLGPIEAFLVTTNHLEKSSLPPTTTEAGVDEVDSN
jgi:hypothetical protein